VIPTYLSPIRKSLVVQPQNPELDRSVSAGEG
jgi:hypothetical protein